MLNKKPKTRLFVDNVLYSGAVYLIDGNQGHYLVNVLRIKVGDSMVVFNGSSGEWAAEVEKVGKGKTQIKIGKNTADQTKDRDIWYVYAPVKKARIDYMMQKATELGVSRIVPIVTNRTNLDRIKPDKIVSNVIEAAEQCGRMTIPQIDDLMPLEQRLNSWPEDRVLIFCDEGGDAGSIADIKIKSEKWAVLIGPEGGFTKEERHMIRMLENTIPVSLGPRILRADTAAVAALSLWQSFLGDWINE